MRDKLIYYIYQQFSKGTGKLYLWLTFLSILPIFILSLIIFVFPNSSPFSSFLKTFYSQLLAALDPGNLLVFELVGDADQNWQNNLVFIICSLIATLLGLIVIASLIGIISASIQEIMLNLRKGRTKVIENNHIIILGWTDEIFSILSELNIAHENSKKQAVLILSQKDPVFMNDNVEDRVNTDRLNMIYRKGSPIDVNDLGIISLKYAKSVIILADKVDRDIQAIKICLAINLLTGGNFNYSFSVVVGMDDINKIKLLERISNNKINAFNIHYLHSKIIAQCCRASGLSVIYSDLLDFKGNELYFVSESELTNKSFRDAVFYYENSSVIGVSSEKNIIIQPDNDYKIQQNDKVICIQEDDNLEEKAVDQIIDQSVIKKEVIINKTKQDILIINWNEDGKYLINDLCEYIDDSSKIDVLLDVNSTFNKEDVEKKLNKISHKIRTVISGDVTSREVLSSLSYKEYNSIVILSESIIPDIDISNKSDAKTILTLLQLRAIKKERSIAIPVISQIQNPTNKQLTDQKSSDDFIVSQQLVGHYTCQLAENPKLKLVFDEILKPEGSEIYLRDVSDYLDIDKEINFFTVIEAFIDKKELPIGYKVYNEILDSETHGIHLNPNKSKLISFAQEDKIIVLTES
mgnify:CR=1 FL=1